EDAPRVELGLRSRVGGSRGLGELRDGDGVRLPPGKLYGGVEGFATGRAGDERVRAWFGFEDLAEVIRSERRSVELHAQAGRRTVAHLDDELRHLAFELCDVRASALLLLGVPAASGERRCFTELA